MGDACYELEMYVGREGRRRVSRHVPQPPAFLISDVSFLSVTILTPSALSIKSYILLGVCDYFIKEFPLIISLLDFAVFLVLILNGINSLSLEVIIYTDSIKTFNTKSITKLVNFQLGVFI